MFNINVFFRVSKILIVLVVLLYSSFALSERQAIQIESLLGDQIPAVISFPDDISNGSPVPACIVLHGSGGLFQDNEPGENCSSEMESNYEAIFNVLESLGVAVLAPDSFGRSSKFCEDNTNAFMQYAPPPFFNLGDGTPSRSDKYKIRRIETRVLDAGGALKFLHELESIDSKNICVIGTSNGGSAALVVAANGTGRHASEFSDTNVQRTFESQDDFQERKDAFINFPTVPSDIEDQFLDLPVLKFAQAISPGCYLRKMIPTEDPIGSFLTEYPDDFFHPEDGRGDYSATYVYAEIGGFDDVPDHCRVDGIRHIQAMAYEDEFNIDPPQWIPTEYPGFDHDLVGDNLEILIKTRELVINHFYRISKNGFE